MTTSRAALDGGRVAAVPSRPPNTGQVRRLGLAGVPRPVALARAFTSRALADWTGAPGPADDLRQDALLLVAELVANAMVHAGGPLELALGVRDGRLRVEVRDGSPRLPDPHRPHDPGTPGGHGLFIVRRTAHRWGAVPDDRGKTVWAEIDLAQPGR